MVGSLTYQQIRLCDKILGVLAGEGGLTLCSLLRVADREREGDVTSKHMH